VKEDFLYYLWKFQKFDRESLKTQEGTSLQILTTGSQNYLSGPDFFDARLVIAGIKWAGNVEMHIKSSDWYMHNHELDPAYDNVILHVVWEHDQDIFRKDGSVVPVLVLKDLTPLATISTYQELLETRHSKINCELDFGNFQEFEINHWFERLYFERLEYKTASFLDVLRHSRNDWNSACMILLFRAFGLNVNGDYFASMARGLGYPLISKVSSSQFSMEALLLGTSGLIQGVDQYSEELRAEFQYLQHKFSLPEPTSKPQFFRLRPDNFPTIRLAQLAGIYHQAPGIFSGIIGAKDIEGIKENFSFKLSGYWEKHYNFGVLHAPKTKKLTNAFMDLLVINFVVPLKMAYSKFTGAPSIDIYEMVSAIKAEKNNISSLFNSLRPGTVRTASDSQAVNHLKNYYCNKGKCLSCELGAGLLNKSGKYA